MAPLFFATAAFLAVSTVTLVSFVDAAGTEAAAASPAIQVHSNPG